MVRVQNNLFSTVKIANKVNKLKSKIDVRGERN